MRISSAITIGFFDGVHRGHRYLLGQLEKLAGAKGLLPVAVTFDQHPRQVLKKGEAPLLLTTQAEKMSLLANAFNGETIVLPFTQEMLVSIKNTLIKAKAAKEAEAKGESAEAGSNITVSTNDAPEA